MKTYTENSVDKRIPTTVAHSNPVTNEENNIDVLVSVKENTTIYEQD